MKSNGSTPRLSMKEALAQGYSVVVFASDLPSCEEANGTCGCEEKWCAVHGCHYADCDCIGPTEDEVAYIYGVGEDGTETLMGRRQ